MTSGQDVCVEEPTTPGNYFVSNYPPYSFWTPDHVGEAYTTLDRAPAPGTPLGVYVHIPFCRKRCHFCYFKVYTDKNASDVESYLDVLGARGGPFNAAGAVAGAALASLLF